MILCSKLKNCLSKIVTKSQVVTKFNVTKSRLHCIDFIVLATHSKISLSQKRLSLTDQVEAVGQKAVHKFIIEPNQRRKSMEMMINFSASDSEERTSGESSSDELSGGANGKNWYFVTKIVLTYCEKKMFW